MKKYSATIWYENSPSAYVANGFIGFRIPSDPFKFDSGLLSGFTGIHRDHGVEALCVIPTPELLFSKNGVPAEFKPVRQTYDYSCGELETELVCEIGGTRITLCDTVFCSRTSPTLLLREMKLSAEKPVRLDLTVSYRLMERLAFTVSECCDYGPFGEDHDGKCLLYSGDRTTTAGMAFRLFGDYTEKTVRGTMMIGAAVEVKPEGSTLRLITSYVPGVMHSEPHNQAHRMIKLAAWNGFDRLREQNRLAWKKLWESRIVIEGASEEWQDAVDASFFYLFCSVSEFAAGAVAPFGLSNPDVYQGHCFWDTESFLFMTPLFCAPEIARSMLEYRCARIPMAKANARLNGYQGIQFPWQSGATGAEVTVPYAGQAGGAGEQHVNLDVALAFDGYCRMTGDMEFLRESAWQVLRGVAEWIVSRAEKTKRGYEILHVTGIDEEHDNVSNDSYTNLMARKLLRSAAAYSEMLGFGERKKWLEIADMIVIPQRDDGVLPQYEGMPEAEKQPSTTLMSYFPYGYSAGAEQDRKTFSYYISHGMKDYLRYPMLSGFLGIYPAWLGDRELAKAYYEKANLTFFCEPFHACTEWSIPDPEDQHKPKILPTTSFITARGSFLAGLIMGLTKICPWKGDVNADPSEWLGENIVLPAGWKSITVGKICIRGKYYRAKAVQGAERTVLTEITE